MSVLDALDATRICARSSAALADPAVWAMPVPTRPRHEVPVAPDAGYSWWSLVRNPHAMLVTGMVGTVVVKDAALRLLGSAR